MAYVVCSSIADAGSRRYPPNELLHLRTSLSQVICPVNRFNKLADIDAISRIPSEAMKHPERFTCPTSSLAEISYWSKDRQSAKKHNSETSEEIKDYTSGAAHSRRASRSSRWSLRRRDASDQFSQPYSAPTDAATHQSENFQKFYRAVVSPTHVRVTAGGRIVPNTRNAAPPAFEWNTEKVHFDHRETAEQIQMYQTTSWFPGTPLASGLPPAQSNTYLAACNIMPQAATMPVVTLPSLNLTGFANNGQASSHSVHNSKTSDSPGQHPGTLPQHIKISPPTQFDQTKPFMFNGQVIFPAPLGYQPPQGLVPVSMVRNPNLVQQPPTSVANIAPRHIPYSPVNFPHLLHLPPQFQLPNNLSSRENLPHTIRSGQVPMSRASSQAEFTKSQIQGLRNTVQWINSQIGNKQQQIDEALLLQQRSGLLSSINHLESMLKLQLAQELDNAGEQADDKLSDEYGGKSSPALISSDHSMNLLANKSSSAPTSVVVDVAGQQTPETTEGQGVITNNETKSSTLSDGMSKSRLTAAAAKAPPFQPRTQSTPLYNIEINQNVVGSNAAPVSAMEYMQVETQAEVEARLLSRASSDWNHRGFSNAGSRPTSLSKASSMQEQLIHLPQGPHPLPLPRSLSFPGQTSFVPQAMTPFITSQPIPYLVGVLPHGVSRNEVNPLDINYPRELTDAEKVARHLYWGKTPRSLQRGFKVPIPKFDGKDFFPASPIKANAAMFPSLVNSNVNIYRSSMPEHGYSKELAETLVQGNQAAVRYPLDHPTLFPVSISDCSSSSIQCPAPDGHKSESITPPLANRSGKRGVQALLDSFTPPRPTIQQTIVESNKQHEEFPVTPKNTEFQKYTRGDENDLDKSESWALPQNNERDLPAIKEAQNDEESNDSTVEIHLSPQDQVRSPNSDLEGSFAERVASFSNADQQTLFLQNMLKKQATSTMAGPISSGKISSATARGYLPQYRGSAAASLAPTIMNIPGTEREAGLATSKPGLSKGLSENGAQLGPVNFLSENRPLSRGDRSLRPSSEQLSAEGYMRYLSQKAEEDKRAEEQGWTSGNTGTGHVAGSDW